MDTIAIKCLRCENLVAVLKEHVHRGAICDSCIADDEKKTSAARHAEQLLERWESMCPYAFQKTEFSRLPCQDKSKHVLQWPFHEHADRYGLMLWGLPRTGKTRTMWLILKREFFAGKLVAVFSPGDFMASYDRANRKRGPWLRWLSTVDLLAFDDIDKFKLPRTVEEAFFAIVNARTSHHRPIFFTGNADGDALKLKFNLGEPLIARIRECCFTVHFP